MVVFWRYPTRWPEKACNFNVINDIRAARVAFHSPGSFVLFDTETYLTLSLEESESRLSPHGELGRYLHQYRFTDPDFRKPGKGFFDTGDIAALLDRPHA